jgi:hypothetical protein
VHQIIDAKFLELNDDRAKVGAQDLGVSLWDELRLE